MNWKSNFILYHQHFYFSSVIYINYIMPVLKKQSLCNQTELLQLYYHIILHQNITIYKNDTILYFRLFFKAG